MGVTLDAYLMFVSDLCNKLDGEHDKIPNVMNFPKEDLNTIGNFIHHFFIQLGLFLFTFLRQQLSRLFLVRFTRQS